MDNTGQSMQNGTDRLNAQEASIDHYQSIVDRAHQEIEGVRSVYKWLAGSLGIILATAIAAATYLTYNTMVDMRAHLDEQVTYVAKKVESRVDDEFKKENIQSLVQQKAQDRIDEVADIMINKQLTQIINPKLAEFDEGLSSVKQELAMAGSKLKELESEALKELRETSKYMMTVTAAQNEDRRAFDQLQEWVKDQDSPFRVKAQQAWQKILDDHTSPFIMSGYTVPWKEDVDPSKFGINELRKSYESAPAHVRLALVEYIWKRNDFPKKEKMQFIVEVLRKDANLKVVEHAARYFMEVSGQKIKPLAVNKFLDWWDENKDTIQ